jgi:hypothetical protein
MGPGSQRQGLERPCQCRSTAIGREVRAARLVRRRSGGHRHKSTRRLVHPTLGPRCQRGPSDHRVLSSPSLSLRLIDGFNHVSSRSRHLAGFPVGLNHFNQLIVDEISVSRIASGQPRIIIRFAVSGFTPHPAEASHVNSFIRRVPAQFRSKMCRNDSRRATRSRVTLAPPTLPHLQRSARSAPRTAGRF